MFPVFSLSLSQFEITQYEVVRRQCTTQVLGLAEKCGVLNFIFFFFFEYLYDIFFMFSPTKHVIWFLEEHVISESEQPFLAPFRFFHQRGTGSCTCLCFLFQQTGSAGAGKTKHILWICLAGRSNPWEHLRGLAVSPVPHMLTKEDGTWCWCEQQRSSHHSIF